MALTFTTYNVTDPNFGGMRVSTIAIPAGWRASSQVRWDFGCANYPVRVYVRVQSPDGKMWTWDQILFHARGEIRTVL